MRRLTLVTAAMLLAASAVSWGNEPPASPAPAPCPSSLQPAADGSCRAPPRAYLVFRSEFPDPEKLKPYGRAVVPVVERFGGRFIVTANQPETIEGRPDPRRLVIIEFPSLAAAQAFWTSPEYAEVKKLREGIGEVQAVIAEGRQP
jgi:uncharacterized protein (DUF1330 family)